MMIQFRKNQETQETVSVGAEEGILGMKIVFTVSLKSLGTELVFSVLNNKLKICNWLLTLIQDLEKWEKDSWLLNKTIYKCIIFLLHAHMCACYLTEAVR